MFTAQVIGPAGLSDIMATGAAEVDVSKALESLLRATAVMLDEMAREYDVY